MKRNTAIYILCFSIVVIMISSCNSNNTKVQQEELFSDSVALKADNPHLDLGNIYKKDKETKTFQFKVKNVSKETVVINKIDVSCNCISINKESYKPIPAGQTGYINGNIMLNKTKGHISKAIFVNYDGNKVLLLRVIAQIE